MFTIKGKYNFANVMLPDEGSIDDETKKQIYGFLNHPAFANSYIAVMPDCHAGNGACIGFTMKMNEYVIPNIVGVDIGCGVESINIGKIKIDLQKLDGFIRTHIPSGFSVNTKCDSFVKGNTLKGRIEDISVKIGSDLNRNVLSVGSLGGGNHFIEVGQDEEKNIWITVHTGSRKFGLDICNYHQNVAKNFMRKVFHGADAYNKLEFLIDKDKENYLGDMMIAQEFATLNRNIILNKIREYLNIPSIKVIKHVSSVHNYIDLYSQTIRKGAISAKEGEEVIIPFNMEDGLIIGKGRGNSKWNCSAPHGAGRLLSRTKAKQVLSLSEMKTNMDKAGVFTTSLSENTLDEAKGAYKDKDMILEVIKETVDVKHFVKPIYNFKASE